MLIGNVANFCLGKTETAVVRAIDVNVAVVVAVIQQL